MAGLWISIYYVLCMFLFLILCKILYTLTYTKDFNIISLGSIILQFTNDQITNSEPTKSNMNITY